MPRRLKALAALLLALIVCLVLVLPQVDLENGVLRDVQNQLSLFSLMLFAGALILLLPPKILCRSRESEFKDEVPLYSGGRGTSILRC
jgi:hypothetical protein